MATVSVYLQQAGDFADHVLYGVVNAVTGTAPNQVVSVGTQNDNYGGSNFFGETAADKGPFEGSVGKTVRRYTAANWNTRANTQRPYALPADVGTVAIIKYALFLTYFFLLSR